MAEALLSVHGIVFLSFLLIFQSVLIFWSFRLTGSAAVVFLVAFLPMAGVPLVLHRNRASIRDNHIAGAVTYVILFISVFAFLFWYPEAMEDDIPWTLIHTMQFFSFLGLVNLVLSPSSKVQEAQGWITTDKEEGEAPAGPSVKEA
jgi:hypothetical protein